MYHVTHNKSQQGVTLLLALFVLSGLTLVTLAVAGFTIQEIRASRAVIAAEPALNAAESGAEQGLWAVKTGVTVPICPSSTTATTSNNAFVGYCKSYEGSTFTVTSAQSTVVYLYNPNDPAGDVDLSEYPYSTLTIANQSGGFNLSVTVRRFDDSTNGISLTDFQITPGNTEIVNISALVADSEARMIITITSTDNNIVFVDTDRGLPSNLNLSSTACSSKSIVTSCTNVDQELYTRKIEVNVPQ